MRTLAIFALMLAGLYGVIVVATALAQRRMMYPGAFADDLRDPIATPAGFEVVAIRTADGESLHGLWRPPRAGCGVIVTFHGNGSRPEWHAARFAAEPWRGGGWGVLAIAYRGYVGSTGSPDEGGLIEDGFASARFAREHAPAARTLLHGHSLGAAVAIAVAERAPHLGLYLEAPFDSMSHLASLLFPYLPTGLLLRDTYRSDLRVAAGDRPVLIVQGRDDDIVPTELAQALARAAGPRAHVEIVPADHDTVFGYRDAEAEPFFRSLLASSCALPSTR